MLWFACWGGCATNTKAKVTLDKCPDGKSSPPNIDDIDGVGAIVIPLIYSDSSSNGNNQTEHKIEVHVSPSIFENTGKSSVLWLKTPAEPDSISSFYHPVCKKTREDVLKLYSNYAKLNYPRVSLIVGTDEEHYELLKELLTKLKNSWNDSFLEDLQFLEEPIPIKYCPSNDSSTSGCDKKEDWSKADDWLKNVFEKEEAKFLKGLPFEVTVKYGNDEFTVKSTGNKGEPLQDYIPEQGVIGENRENEPPTKFPPYKKKPGSKLIIVPLSSGLEKNAQVIQDSLFEVFSELKGNKTPFTLLTIQSGRLVSSLLSSKKLRSLPPKGDKSLLTTIQKMQFGATDLRALDDLKWVDTYIDNEQLSIGEVLYLTDNTRIDDSPPIPQLGVPMAWRIDRDICLTVLTTKKCDVWNRVGANCTSWDGKKEALTNQLEDFLQN